MRCDPRAGAAAAQQARTHASTLAREVATELWKSEAASCETESLASVLHRRAPCV